MLSLDCYRPIGSRSLQISLKHPSDFGKFLHAFSFLLFVIRFSLDYSVSVSFSVALFHMRKLSQTFFYFPLLHWANAICEKLENVAICQCRRSTYAFRFRNESIMDDKVACLAYVCMDAIVAAQWSNFTLTAYLGTVAFFFYLLLSAGLPSPHQS